MKRSTKLATTAIVTATTLGLVASPANAQSSDRGLYPDTGTIHINPIATKILGNSPLGDMAGAGEQFALNTIGVTATSAVLGVIHDVINGPIRDVAQYPNGNVTVSWKFDSRYLKWEVWPNS